MTIEINPVVVRRFILRKPRRHTKVRDYIIHSRIGLRTMVEYELASNGELTLVLSPTAMDNSWYPRTNWHLADMNEQIQWLIMNEWEEVDLETRHGQSVVSEIESDIKEKESSPTGDNTFIDFLDDI